MKHKLSLTYPHRKLRTKSHSWPKSLINGGTSWRTVQMSCFMNNALGSIEMESKTRPWFCNARLILLPHACTNTISSCLSSWNVLRLAPILDALVNERNSLGKWLVFSGRLILSVQLEDKRNGKSHFVCQDNHPWMGSKSLLLNGGVFLS